jgi:hypothetical protein
MTQSEARTYLRYMLAEPNTDGYYDDVFLNILLNMGCRELARNVNILITSEDEDLTSGTKEYSLPDNFVRPIKVVLSHGTWQQILPSEDFSKLDPATNDSQPVLYYIRGSYIGFEPTPGGSYTATINYVYLPTDLETDGTDDDSDLPIPTTYHDYILPYCVWRLKAADDKANTNDWQEWLKAIDEARHLMISREHDHYSMPLQTYGEGEDY